MNRFNRIEEDEPMEDIVKQQEEVRYSAVLSKGEIKEDIKIILTYVALIILWYAIDQLYGNFGRKWITLAVGAMWIMGGVTAYLLREEQMETIKHTKTVIAGYLLILLVYRIVISTIASITAEEMAVSLDISIPTVSGQAISGFLQNIFMIIAVMTPIGFLIFCAQKFKNFKAGLTKEEAFRKIKDIRKK